jgi:hypothetical protein
MQLVAALLQARRKLARAPSVDLRTNTEIRMRTICFLSLLLGVLGVPALAQDRRPEPPRRVLEHRREAPRPLPPAVRERMRERLREAVEHRRQLPLRLRLHHRHAPRPLLRAEVRERIRHRLDHLRARLDERGHRERPAPPRSQRGADLPGKRGAELPRQRGAAPQREPGAGRGAGRRPAAPPRGRSTRV